MPFDHHHTQSRSHQRITMEEMSNEIAPISFLSIFFFFFFFPTRNQRRRAFSPVHRSAKTMDSLKAVTSFDFSAPWPSCFSSSSSRNPISLRSRALISIRFITSTFTFGSGPWPSSSPCFFQHFSSLLRRRWASVAVRISSWSVWFRWPTFAPSSSSRICTSATASRGFLYTHVASPFISRHWPNRSVSIWLFSSVSNESWRKSSVNSSSKAKHTKNYLVNCSPCASSSVPSGFSRRNSIKRSRSFRVVIPSPMPPTMTINSRSSSVFNRWINQTTESSSRSCWVIPGSITVCWPRSF